MSENAKCCTTAISPEWYALLPSCEAVIVRRWRAGGEEFGKVMAIGSMEEMEEYASTNRLMIVPPGVELVGVEVVPVSELIPPDVSKGKS